jgi:hypothetical protein
MVRTVMAQLLARWWQLVSAKRGNGLGSQVQDDNLAKKGLIHRGKLCFPLVHDEVRKGNSAVGSSRVRDVIMR